MVAADVDRFVALDNEPLVKRYIDGGKPAVRAEVESVVAQAIGHRWTATRRNDGTFVGWFGLSPSSERERELGYRLMPASWGTGLATEGSQALVRHAFHDLGAVRVWAQTMTVNLGSRRVLEKCGLTFVRTFFEDWPDSIEGTDEGDVIYEAESATWLAAHAVVD